MAGFDILILVILAIGAFRGWRRGFVASLFTLGGCFVGLVVAYLLNSQLGTTLAPHIGTSLATARIIVFFLLWVVIPIGMGVAGQMITSILNFLNLGTLNRLGGAAVGLLKYFVVMACFVTFCSYAGIEKEAREHSVGCAFMESFTKAFISAVPEGYNNGY